METKEKCKSCDEDELKKDYNALKQKYGLPKFESLAEDFDIEKICDKQTSFLLREIRRTINEKFSAYMHLLENLINPAAPPMFIFTILKNVSEDEKELIKDLYKRLSRLQIESMKLDTIYNEKNEAEFIVKSSKDWEYIKKSSYNLFEEFAKKYEEEGKSKTRGYFG